ncbi:MAG TPA: allantoinase [bacterium]|nr:allantoinase [bacterium]
MATPKLRLVKREHTLIYGLRLLPDEVLAEQTHPRVEVPRPDGGTETLTVHTITGDREEIKRKLLESVDAFFEIHGDKLP